MGFRAILVLLGLLAAVGMALWLSEDRVVEHVSLTDSVLDGRSIVDAHRLVLQRDATSLPIEFERGPDGNWQIVEPIRDLASAAVIEQLRTAFDGAQLVVAYEPDEVDGELLDATGLAEPQSKIRVEWPDGRAVELAIGLPGPFGQDLFARRIEAGASARIYRVQVALRNALQLNTDDAREASVFVAQYANLRSLRVDRRLGDGRDVLRVVRRGTGWAMEQPAGLRIDQAQADGFVRALLGLRIDEFLPGRPEPGLSPIDPEAAADVTIDVEGTFGAERVRLWFVADGAGIVGHDDRRDLWFSCDAHGYRQLVELPIRQLRAYWLLSDPVDELRTLRVLDRRGGAVAFELQKHDLKGFRLSRPIQRDTDPTAVNELLQGLRSLVAVEFVEGREPDALGLGDDALVLEVEVRPGRPERLLLGADAGDDTTWLKRADEAQIVTIPRPVAERIRRPWTTYVSKVVLRITTGANLRSMLRTTADGDRIGFARGDDGRWRRGGEGDALPLVAEVFELLRDLRAKEVVPEVAVGEVRSEGSLELVADSGQVVARLGLAADAEGHALISDADAPGVYFVLSARDGRDLLALK